MGQLSYTLTNTFHWECQLLTIRDFASVGTLKLDIILYILVRESIQSLVLHPKQSKFFPLVKISCSSSKATKVLPISECVRRQPRYIVCSLVIDLLLIIFIIIIIIFIIINRYCYCDWLWVWIQYWQYYKQEE